MAEASLKYLSKFVMWASLRACLCAWDEEWESDLIPLLMSVIRQATVSYTKGCHSFCTKTPVPCFQLCVVMLLGRMQGLVESVVPHKDVAIFLINVFNLRLRNVKNACEQSDCRSGVVR